MTATKNRPTPMFRQLGPGGSICVDTPTGLRRVEPGDWMEASVLRHVGREDRRRLGPVVTRAKLERDTGERIEDGQVVVRVAPRSVRAPGDDAPTVGVAVVGPDLAECERVAHAAAATAHVPVVTASGPQAIGALRSMGVAWIAVVPQAFRASTGWLARLFGSATDDEGDGEDHAPRFMAAVTGAPVLFRVGRNDGFGPEGDYDFRPYLPALRFGPLDSAGCVGGPKAIGDLLTQYPDARAIAVCAVVEFGAWEDACLRAMLATGAPAAVPVHNVGEPFALPTVTDDSPLPRLPGGRGVEDIDLALRALAHAPVRGIPARPAAIVLRRDVAEAVARGERPDISGAVTATDAFVWVERETDHIANLVSTGGGQAETWAWAPFADRARRAVAAVRPRGLPVALYSSNVGPWGGVAVLFRLADELQRLGMSAAVVHHTTTEHRMRPQTAPLKVRNGMQLVSDWAGAVGWRNGILVASHWGSGKAVKAITAANPGIVATSFLQDREDLFEDPHGLPVGARNFGEYLAINRGVAVARWIIDSAADELGLDPTGYRVICPGVDCEVFRPRPRAKGGPVRILAMWRPQTAVRRGIKLLREVYDATHRRFGAAVSLEVFGWNDRSGPGRAPDYVRHHGHLSPAQVAALMAECDVVLEPSAMQGWGLSGVEAMACGAAVVSTDCYGPRDYILHRHNGLIVPHLQLEESLREVIEDENLRRSLQDSAADSIQWLRWEYIGAEWACYLGELWAERNEHATACRASVERAKEVLSNRPARPPGLRSQAFSPPQTRSYGTTSTGKR